MPPPRGVCAGRRPDEAAVWGGRWRGCRRAGAAAGGARRSAPARCKIRCGQGERLRNATGRHRQRRHAARGGTRNTSACSRALREQASRGYISQLAGLLRGWRTLISTPLTLTREFAGIDSVTNAPPAITVPSPITVSPPSTLALE